MSQYEMNDEDKLYDEFGNYIGPDLSDEDSDDSSNSDSDDWDEFPTHDASPRSPRSQQRHNTNQKITPQPMQQDNNNNNDDDDVDLVEINETNIQNEFETSKSNTMKLVHATHETETKTADSNAIVLHEDKEYYKSAVDTYGTDVEIQVEEEDTQPIEQPIIAPIREKCFELIETSLPKTTFNWKFLASLMDLPFLIRNIGFIGHLHHGKTSFIDMLIKETHIEYRERDYNDHIKHFKKTKHNNYPSLRYTDTRKDEQARGLSIKTVPISLVLPDLRGKHWLINCMDTPGHVNFSDEITACLRLIDGAVIIVDCCEGVLLNTKRAIRHALNEGIPWNKRT